MPTSGGVLCATRSQPPKPLVVRWVIKVSPAEAGNKTGTENSCLCACREGAISPRKINAEALWASALLSSGVVASACYPITPPDRRGNAGIMSRLPAE